jgi:hypothetical protein
MVDIQHNEAHQTLKKEGGEYKRGNELVQSTLHMYGTITMKSPHINNVCPKINIEILFTYYI